MPKRLRTPIRWFGGKGMMVSKILKLLPDHRIYVEPFGGGASVLLAKTPSEIEVYNDIDRVLYDFFTVLADPDLFEKFYRRVALLPYSRQLYYEYRASWVECQDVVERVVRWFVVAKQSFGGYFAKAWGFAFQTSSRGLPETVSKWLSCLGQLPEIHRRLRRVQIENLDWREILDKYDSPNTLFYCDPPYPHVTRRDGWYNHEMSDDRHREFVACLREIRGKALVSTYPNEIYARLADFGWNKVEFKTICFAAARTRLTGILGRGAGRSRQSRTEVIWISPRAKGSFGLSQ